MKITMHKLLLSLCFVSATLAANQLPMIIDPVVNATPPGAKVSAGYVSIMNKSDESLTLTGAYSPDIPKVEIHLSFVDNDVAKMEKQESVEIAAGETLQFKHGSYHLMLMGLTEPLKEGETVDIILTTSSGDLLIEMPIKKIGSNMDENPHGDMDMDKKIDNKMKDGDTHTESTKVVH